MSARRTFDASRILAVFGAVLLLGGTGHSVGIVNLYSTVGIPDANRVLVDIWVAQTQLVAGGLCLTASRAHRRHRSWRALAVFGALTVVGFSVPMLPVLESRAPFIFRVPAAVYLLVSLAILAAAATATSDAK